MKVEFTESYLADDLGLVAFADGLTVHEQGDQARLYLTGQSLDQIATIDISANGTTDTTLSNWSASASIAATEGDGGFAIADSGSHAVVYSFATSNSALRATAINANGSLGNSEYVTSDVGRVGSVSSVTTLRNADNQPWISVSEWGKMGLKLNEVETDAAWRLVQTIEDTEKSYVKDVSASLTATVGDVEYLVTTSALENGITTYTRDSSGDFQIVDSLGNIDGLAINGASALEIVDVAGDSFVLMASSGSNSLSILRINDMGALFETDHQIDDRNTRFDNAAVMDTFTDNDRSFVVVAGSDHGASVFEIMPGGTLAHMTTLVAEGGLSGPALYNVTEIQAVVVGDAVEFFMLDEHADTLQHYSVSLATLGDRITASNDGSETLGTSGDDLLLGSAADDRLSGGSGDDRLIDFDGADSLTGGAGADTFVLVADDSDDQITDYELSVDMINVSAWGRIYDLRSLTVTETDLGADISYGQHKLTIKSADGQSIDPDALSNDDFLFT